MNCQEALNLMYDIIDKEASEIDREAVENHLKKCHDCFDKYRIAGALQEFINEKLKEKEDTPNLEFLKNNILEKLDNVDIDGNENQGYHSFRIPAVALSAAASLVIIVTMFYFLAGSGHLAEHDMHMSLQNAHMAASRHNMDSSNSEFNIAPVEQICTRLNYGMAKDLMGFSLIGAHIDTIMNVEMAHIIYQESNITVSVFLASSDAMSVPPNTKELSYKDDDHKFYLYNCPKCRLVYFKRDQATIITASDNTEVDLRPFILSQSSL